LNGIIKTISDSYPLLPWEKGPGDEARKRRLERVGS